MARIGSFFGNFAAELQRRRVLRVLGIYAIVVWAVLQLAANTFEPLSIPIWVHTALIIALVAGFPAVAVLAWVFDITPHGIVRTAPVEGEARLNEIGEAISEHPRLWIDVLIFTVLVGIVAFLLLRPGDHASVVRAPSIAVLPFSDMSEFQDSAFFSDGVTEALLDSITKIPGLQVVARTSSFAYKGHPGDVREIGTKLGAESILEGSVRRMGDRVLITAQLIDVSTGYHLWSETYERTLDDIFAVQDEIARSIARTLQLRLLPDTDGLLRDPGTRDVQAYDLYLRGRGALRQAWTSSNLERAIEYFTDALRVDPRMVLADAGLCSAHWEMYQLNREQEQFDHALDACQTALARDSTLPDVHVALGWIYEGTGRVDLAREAFARGLALDPGNADAMRGMGLVQDIAGEHQQAESTLRRVVELEPDYWRSYASLGQFLYYRGRYDEALEVFIRGTERNPNDPHLLRIIGGIYIAMGKPDKAEEAFLASLAVSPTHQAYLNAGTNYFAMGRFEDAREMYERAVALSPNNYEAHRFLADACRQLEGGSECAERHYNEAIILGKDLLKRNPDMPVLIASIGILYARIGDMDAANELMGRLMTRWPGHNEVLRAAAVVALLADERERALQLLEQAVSMGYPVSLLEKHPDYDVIRDEPRFQALVDGV